MSIFFKAKLSAESKKTWTGEIKAIQLNQMTTVGSDPNVRVTQIEEKQYKEQLTARGIPAEHIRSYGFAFEGKTVMIG